MKSYQLFSDYNGVKSEIKKKTRKSVNMWKPKTHFWTSEKSKEKVMLKQVNMERQYIKPYTMLENQFWGKFTVTTEYINIFKNFKIIEFY